MSTRLIPIKPQSPNVTFSLLFVPHGFSDRAAFHALCVRAVGKLVSLAALDPFKLVRGHIRAWTSWPATAESLTVRDGGVFMDDAPALFGHLATLNMPAKFPFAFWVDPATRLRRGVVVLTNAFAEPMVTPHFPFDFIVPDTGDDSGTYGLGPFVVMTAWPFVSGSQPTYVNDHNRELALAGQLAQAIGFLLGLGPEADISPGGASYDGPDLLFPNLTRLPSVPSGSSVDLAQWRWRGLRGKNVGSTGSIRAHPGAATTGAAVTDLINAAKTATLVLQHPGGASPLRHVRPPLKGLTDIGTNLIAGGLGFTADLYRPAVECTMRYSGWDDTKTNGDVIRQLVGFCPVCRKRVGRIAYGLGDYYWSTPRVIANPALARNSNVANALKKFVEVELPDLRVSAGGHDYTCVEATTERVSRLFAKIARYHVQRQTTLADWGEWQASGFLMPSREFDGRWTADIWLSRLNPLRDAYTSIEPFAAAGAPGALAWSGFGVIVNRYDLARSVELGIKVYESLTVPNLADLTPGSMLQFWVNQGTLDAYDWALRYVASDSGRLRGATGSGRSPHYIERVPKPQDVMGGAGLEGHSLIFLGPKNGAPAPELRTADHYLVADQNKPVTTAASIADWAGRGFNFWIAMEWFPMEGLTDVP